MLISILDSARLNFHRAWDSIPGFLGRGLCVYNVFGHANTVIIRLLYYFVYGCIYVPSRQCLEHRSQSLKKEDKK